MDWMMLLLAGTYLTCWVSARLHILLQWAVNQEVIIDWLHGGSLPAPHGQIKTEHETWCSVTHAAPSTTFISSVCFTGCSVYVRSTQHVYRNMLNPQGSLEDRDTQHQLTTQSGPDFSRTMVQNMFPVRWGTSPAVCAVKVLKLWCTDHWWHTGPLQWCQEESFKSQIINRTSCDVSKETLSLQLFSETSGVTAEKELHHHYGDKMLPITYILLILNKTYRLYVLFKIKCLKPKRIFNWKKIKTKKCKTENWFWNRKTIQRKKIGNWKINLNLKKLETRNNWETEK